jgi:hypothetical protein
MLIVAVGVLVSLAISIGELVAESDIVAVELAVMLFDLLEEVVRVFDSTIISEGL